MRKILSVLIIALPVSLWAQHLSAKAEKAVIEHVKHVSVSKLDGILPDVSLEFFLEYEGGGVAIRWETEQCPVAGKSAVVPDHGSNICVKATLNLKNNRSASILLSVGANKDASDIPTVLDLTVVNQNGAIHHIHKLSNLPVELHRPPPKSPRDLRLPEGANG